MPKTAPSTFLSVLLFVLATAFVSDGTAADGESPKNAPNADAKTTPDVAPQSLGLGADPWVVEYRGRFYRSASDNSKREIVLWVSDSPDERGRRRAIWKAPENGPYSRELWAPEIHFLDGRFYVFFAASNGENRNHRTYVLVSDSDDPLGDYRLEGPLYTGDAPNDPTTSRWAIDATVFERGERRFLIWSGWENDRDVQFLYIAPFSTNPPRTTGPRVKICANDDYLWERVEERPETRGLNEGPEILIAPNGRTFLTYSCGASWLPTYKIALLELVGGDPLDPNSWQKLPEPFLTSDENRFGVGHGSFLRESNGNWRCYYHAKRDRAPGWSREIFWRPFVFDENGFPRLVPTK